VVRSLLAPDTYRDRPARVERIETHFAWIFLAGDCAYKLKKPICFRELDLRTLAARHYVCGEEVRLNRRLAPDVYLGAAALTREADGALRMEGEGEPVEWLVKMRRLPAALMLDRMLAAGGPPAVALAELGRTLARFYADQQRIAFDPHAYRARIMQQIEADCAALRAPELHVPGAVVETLAAVQLAAFGRLQAELDKRAEAQRIVEAHGDLRPEHVCLTHPPCVIDSLEFSFDLRTLDPLEELAYFWIECARLNASRTGDAVVAAWRQASGDPAPTRLFDFYCSRRAAVRAKVVAWHLLDPEVRERAQWSAQAQDLIAAAIQHARNA
jgi:aminoglycoside phosphotransferase family enzyme